jgi:hypothetical protein
MAKRRFGPYTWATWLTPILAGDAQCLFAPWMQSQFQIDKVERGDFDLVRWKIDHADMVTTRADQLRRDGWTVYVEDQNKFTLRGQVTTLAGKPDVVAVRRDDALVIDCKGGKRRSSDALQVLLYMFAIPLYHPAWRPSLRLAGEVQYRDGSLPIQPEQFTPALRERIVALLKRMGNATPPTPVPSASECAWCPVSSIDCKARVEGGVPETAVAEW